MGCSASKSDGAQPTPQPQAAVAASQPGVAPAAGQSKGKGKGQGKGKGKGKPRSAKQIGDIMKGCFQIELQGKWQDYQKDEDGILKKAYLTGQPNCKFSLRGQNYEYDFKKRAQKNEGSGKERKIRPPFGMFQPAKPLLPSGPMVVCTIPRPGKDGKKTSMEIGDPNNPGTMVLVALPPNATPGMRIAVPVPAKSEKVEEVAKRQKEHSKGSKMALGMTALGAAAVGGVVLGEHLSGGALSAWGEDLAGQAADYYADSGAADWVAGAGEDIGAAASAAGEWVEGAAEDGGDWVAGAAEDAGDWGAGAAEEVGDWSAGAAEDIADFGADAADWFGDAAEDAGDFITSLF